jgi:CRP/FNR family transcriptional regulator, cyclic AMP receptor protein
MLSPEAFDAEAFLTTAGTGRTIATYKPKSYIFRQGTKAPRSSIQKGRVDPSVVSGQGKERVAGIRIPAPSSARLPPRPYLASARASMEATLVRVEQLLTSSSQATYEGARLLASLADAAA